MNPLSAEVKLTLAGIAVALLMAGAAYTVTRLLSAGADHEKAAVEKVTAAAALHSQQQSDEWSAKLAAAATARQGELNALQKLALSPVSLRVQRVTLPSGVSANPAPPPSGAGTAAAGLLPCSLVSGSSEEMRDFERARAADQLVADYRLLYDGWPTVQPPQ